MKKFIGRLLVLAAVLMLAAVPAYADDTPSGTAIDSGITTYSLESGVYYLAEDITLPATISIEIQRGNEVTIDLNGHTLTASSTSVIQVGGKLTLVDSSAEQTGTITGGTYGITCSAFGGEVVMNGGTITGINGTSSGAAVSNSGTFTMNGGSITGNTGEWGGGVYNYGTFTMNGGTISNNTASDGSSLQNGGGVYVSGGTFTMNDGTITGCSAANGGGVYVSGGTFNLTGGTITDNITSESGGGIYVGEDVTFTMSGGTITDNTAGTTGGGIHFEAKNGAAVTIAGGAIYENTAQEDMGQDVAIEVSSGDTATLTINSNVNSGIPGYDGWYEEQTKENYIDMAGTKAAGVSPYTNGIYLTAPAGTVAKFYTRTLTLDGDIGVNYYV
ncbi:MAG: hypothetical protein LUH51_04910, partial [Firmicutes bacterium]|nr:hypothetical protein [Bacillota bacterium]